jgi:hypothetical protein
VSDALAPLSGLRLRTPYLELRLPSVAELCELGTLAAQGVHDPDRMPFLVPWTDDPERPGLVDGFTDLHLSLRADWSPEAWQLQLGVWVDGNLAGIQARARSIA